ncbi:hypothetical protein ACHENJ_004312, partial [Escherichia coli]
DVDSPLDMVKQSGLMTFNSTQTLETNIKANLHTFDDRNDVAGFIEASSGDGLFEDIAALRSRKSVKMKGHYKRLRWYKGMRYCIH